MNFVDTIPEVKIFKHKIDQTEVYGIKTSFGTHRDFIVSCFDDFLQRLENLMQYIRTNCFSFNINLLIHGEKMLGLNTQIETNQKFEEEEMVKILKIVV
jgi:hypothetical protein